MDKRKINQAAGDTGAAHDLGGQNETAASP
jgi:hypothetical protein